MRIINPCVVALSWQLTDAQGQAIDHCDEPAEFFVGGNDLLASIQHGLQQAEVGAVIKLHLEPRDAFGDYDEQRVFLEPRNLFPAELSAGMVFATLPPGCSDAAQQCAMVFVSDVYPEHVVLEGNHPLAGMALHLTLTVHGVRTPTDAEQEAQSTGQAFLRVAG